MAAGGRRGWRRGRGEQNGKMENSAKRQAVDDNCSMADNVGEKWQLVG